jgi:para-nitrobenzyl esterase
MGTTTAPVAETTTGRVQGSIEGDVAVFRGIPYAAPTGGAARFRPPEPPASWTGVRDATRFAAIAPQNPSPLEAMFGGARPAMGEDCLALNVWTPATEGGGRPVVVWIHGGAFVTGSGSTPWYDGSSFASRGDVVCVTINYRLGALGFLHLADLGGEAYASSGNLGLLDQVAALTWVRDNIEAFGGDPANVTVFGESAGAMSIGALLGMPAARGLFRRAIPQSGAANHVSSRDTATRVALDLLDALGLDRTQVDRLRDLPVEALLAAQLEVAATRGLGRLPHQPVVDGTAVPESPLEAVTAGSAAGVDLLLGTNVDEMRLFTALDPRIAAIDEPALLTRADELFGPGAGAAAIETYRGTRPGSGAAEVWTAVLSDQVFRVPAVRLAERQSAHAPVHLYLFTWATPAFGGALGSCHALEIPFVFNNLDAPGVSLFTGEPTASARRLAESMHDTWTAFARGGDPNGAGLPPWPPFTNDQRATMVLGEHSTVEEDPAAAELAHWAEVL